MPPLYDLPAAHKAAQARISQNNTLLKNLLMEDEVSATTPVVSSGSSVAGSKVPASSGQLVNWLKQAGFQGEELRKAWAVAMRESGGRPGAFNGNKATGDKSFGLFQINMLGSLGKSRLKSLGLSSEQDLLDPVVNARAAYQMSRGGWSAWDIDTSGYNYKNNRASWQKHYNAYMKYYNMYPSATKNNTLASAAAAKISK